jgi:RHS repeat-associated protein
VQAEDYDQGGSGVAYSDTTPGNAGGVYRSDHVDIYALAGAGNGRVVTVVKAGEWLEYSLNATSGGTRDLLVRVAAVGTGGSFHLELDGVNVSGALAVPDTGAWESFQTVVKTNVNVSAGTHVLRLVLDSNGASGYVGDFDWLAVQPAGGSYAPAWIQRLYYYAGGRRVAVRTLDSQGMDSLQWLLGDHLGSTSVSLDVNGNVVAWQWYDPWGNVRYASGGLPTSYQFTGQRLDASGLYYFNARYYDPHINRWIQPDIIVAGSGALTINTADALSAQAFFGPTSSPPLSPQDLNRFSYVGNNPVRHTDPSGHCFPLCTAAIGGGIGAVVGMGLYMANLVRTGDDWHTGEAMAVALAGTAAGVLIGTGIAAPAGVSAMGALVIASTGMGVAGGGAGYLGVNLIAGNEFDTTDFAIASTIGGASGAASPYVATTAAGSIALNAAANATQYEASHFAHTGSLALDGGTVLSAGAGALGGWIGGPAPVADDLTRTPVRVGGGTYVPGLGWDQALFPAAAGQEIGRELRSGLVRNFGALVASNLYQPD